MCKFGNYTGRLSNHTSNEYSSEGCLSGYKPDEAFMNDSTSTSTGLNSPNMVINVDKLEKSQKYSLRLKIGFAGSVSKVQVTYVLKTSDVPTDGYCALAG